MWEPDQALAAITDTRQGWSNSETLLHSIPPGEALCIPHDPGSNALPTLDVATSIYKDQHFYGY